MINSEFRKKMADSWFSYLQMQICKSFEQLENNKLQFTKREWHKKKVSEEFKMLLGDILSEAVDSSGNTRGSFFHAVIFPIP